MQVEIKEFDTVLLKDGREAAIVEVLDDIHFLADVGDSPADWDTIDVTIDDIERVIHVWSEKYAEKNNHMPDIKKADWWRYMLWYSYERWGIGTGLDSTKGSALSVGIQKDLYEMRKS